MKEHLTTLALFLALAVMGGLFGYDRGKADGLTACTAQIQRLEAQQRHIWQSQIQGGGPHATH
ncbi:hypothetical protein [Magnetococcus sp. PR-3]|uniref:hypothetical protein n=1 Tax=Magnetococcus sp. PR-3 TaxID=3120355 RepID=UPI002FCE1440